MPGAGRPPSPPAPSPLLVPQDDLNPVNPNKPCLRTALSSYMGHGLGFRISRLGLGFLGLGLMVARSLHQVTEAQCFRTRDGHCGDLQCCRWAASGFIHGGVALSCRGRGFRLRVLLVCKGRASGRGFWIGGFRALCTVVVCQVSFRDIWLLMPKALGSLDPCGPYKTPNLTNPLSQPHRVDQPDTFLIPHGLGLWAPKRSPKSSPK